ncbi:MAG: methyl-accepting chemotaxis protein [Deltaproteobacteria bacterium]|nr:methyl-accepting chemotaxis protein [Deltaproteobacteria bacterium]
MKNLVEKTFKLNFGLRLCLLTAAGMLAVTLFLYYATSKDLGDSYGRAIYLINDLKIRIFPLIFASFYSIFILVVITTAIAVISVLYSHKIAGPIYRLEKNLELIGSGDLTVNTRFRRTDQLFVLADEINAMVRSLNHTVRGYGEALLRVQRCEERIEELLKDGGCGEGELKEALLALKSAIDEVKGINSGIKTG